MGQTGAVGGEVDLAPSEPLPTNRACRAQDRTVLAADQGPFLLRRRPAGNHGGVALPGEVTDLLPHEPCDMGEYGPPGLTAACLKALFREKFADPGAAQVIVGDQRDR